ncbi:hypothetical protein AAFF_G00407550 [Aldrovandia affinis]|uniref:Uncharacterized protein n=1 Tax=Aldrovandia affinis TaxID=143900 RepID=A0AAD7SBP1_9TELE|nr:hypothetical protein AAFF_G00407550 [Aldrovandia affinis]
MSHLTRTFTHKNEAGSSEKLKGRVGVKDAPKLAALEQQAGIDGPKHRPPQRVGTRKASTQGEQGGNTARALPCGTRLEPSPRIVNISAGRQRRATSSATGHPRPMCHQRRCLDIVPLEQGSGGGQIDSSSPSSPSKARINSSSSSLPNSLP